MQRYLIILITLFTVNTYAQVTTVDSLEADYLNWYNKSPELDKVCGTDVDRAYETILKDKKPQKVIIVAVIDGGVDVRHEDLKGQVWINKNEIPDNGIDDDKNGYIDDINGWNFIGNSKGEHLNTDNLQVTRIYRDYKAKFEFKTAKDVAEEDKADFEMYTAAKAEYEEYVVKYGGIIERYTKLIVKIETANKALKVFLQKDSISMDDIKGIESEDSLINGYKRLLSRGTTLARLEGAIDYYKIYTESYLNLDLNARANIIGDNPTEMKDAFYGNGDVKGPNADHGSMVSGIIGAVRNNGMGVNGIATGVKIMALRSIPNGDEYDKDVALSIRYAVDNGANIINMSFGKYYSPMESEVYAAIKYAESKGVLMIAASGNEGQDVDSTTHYPTPYSEKGGHVSTWLTVGANSKDFEEKMTATFSNYGAEKVHIFAPGVKVISISPDDSYDMMNGTSFSCPVVTGVAALVWSYYPQLSARDLREIIMESSVMYKNMKVNLPGSFDDGKVPSVKFGKLSESGGVVNAYYALQMAEKRTVEGK
ncbi:MAG: S8 family serine peptidase [Flavobacteriales bacterium]|nr:S8 family serine peptidase [Flavobacteriales bacterium]